ncbi:MAG: hypothetical protein IPK13_14025 [Deltaproteobacteria bacterium]|nr:hypothetical protein [Deltaproteobacteria bacterium]
MREAEATLAAKNDAMATYDARFSEVAFLVSAFLRMAGEYELADRARPSNRRPGQTDGSTPDSARPDGEDQDESQGQGQDKP